LLKPLFDSALQIKSYKAKTFVTRELGFSVCSTFSKTALLNKNLIFFVYGLNC